MRGTVQTDQLRQPRIDALPTGSIGPDENAL
jgi:hypothetical protein